MEVSALVSGHITVRTSKLHINSCSDSLKLEHDTDVSEVTSGQSPQFVDEMLNVSDGQVLVLFQ